MENTKNNSESKKVDNLNKAIDGYLNDVNQDPNLDCSSGVCVVKGDKSLVERINKKIITEDGRQLLF
jgi:hypothetical protein